MARFSKPLFSPPPQPDNEAPSPPVLPSMKDELPFPFLTETPHPLVKRNSLEWPWLRDAEAAPLPSAIPLSSPPLPLKARPPTTSSVISIARVTATAATQATSITTFPIQTILFVGTPDQHSSGIPKLLAIIGVAGSLFTISAVGLFLFLSRRRRKRHAANKRNIPLIGLFEAQELSTLSPKLPDPLTSTLYSGKSDFIIQGSGRSLHQEQFGHLEYTGSLESKTLPLPPNSTNAEAKPSFNQFPRRPSQKYKQAITTIREISRSDQDQISKKLNTAMQPMIISDPQIHGAQEETRESTQASRARERIGIWRDEVLNTPQEIIEASSVFDGEIVTSPLTNANQGNLNLAVSVGVNDRSFRVIESDGEAKSKRQRKPAAAKRGIRFTRPSVVIKLDGSGGNFVRPKIKRGGLDRIKVAGGGGERDQLGRKDGSFEGMSSEFMKRRKEVAVSAIGIPSNRVLLVSS